MSLREILKELYVLAQYNTLTLKRPAINRDKELNKAEADIIKLVSSVERIEKIVLSSKLFLYGKGVSRALADVMKAEYDDPNDIWLKNKAKNIAQAIHAYILKELKKND